MKSETEAALSAATAGSSRWAGKPNPHRPQWRRATRWMLAMQAYLALWFWGVILVNWGLAVIIAAQFGPVTVSFFQFGTHATLWFPFSIMIITTTAAITSHVAQGRTRRSFIRAALITVVVMAIGYGLIMTAGLALEGAFYDVFGWSQGHVAEMDSSSSTAALVAPWREPVGVTLLTYATRTGGGAIAGLLVGACYYRFGGWRGTWLLPLSALPALAAQDSISGFLRDATGSGWALNAVILLSVIAAGALAYHLLFRTIPITNPRS